MNLSIISFTPGGYALAQRIRQRIQEPDQVTLYTKCSIFREKGDSQEARFVEESIAAWTKEQFKAGNPLVFIGACGIAVRAAAPALRDKLTDVPVLVLDEGGRFVIPLLSGHYGGANELAEKLAGLLDAVPVLTTATDVRGLFAVDVFARKNHLALLGRENIKKVSGELLAGKEVTFTCGGKIGGKVPKELTFVPYPPDIRVSVAVSPFTADGERADLQLCPRAYVVGIGCRRGKTMEEIEDAVKRQTARLGIYMEAVEALASIDRKREEAGIVEFCRKYGIPFYTFNRNVLLKTTGSFHGSSFVEAQVGVDNVCERAALAQCGENGTLVSPKWGENGITTAVAEKRWSVRFDEE